MSQTMPQILAALMDANPPPALVYLVGAGGCGMSGLGHLLLDAGYRVAGSDLVNNTEVRQLRQRGANIFQGHQAEHIRQTRPFLVVYSSAIQAENPELQMARELCAPIVRRAELLSCLSQRGRAICVAGMHGKTTTTAWLAYALGQLGARPGYAIGSLVPQLVPHATLGGSRLASLPDHASGEIKPWLVLETDESDGTLVQFHPEQAIILNVDEDHLDYFGTLDKVCAEFSQFAQQVKSTVYYSADEPWLTKVIAGARQAISFGYHPEAHYRVARPKVSEAGHVGSSTSLARCEIWHHQEKLGDFSLRLRGEKNFSNACAVVAVLHQMGYQAGEIAIALAGFKGAARRQQALYSDANYTVFDDYGHHPREILATLQAFKETVQGRLLVVFQPHRYTRTRDLLGQFATCFQAADLLWLTEIYAASEAPISGITGLSLADAVRAAGQAVTYVPGLAELRQAVRQALRPKDCVLFLGAGDITRAAHEFAEELEVQQGREMDAVLSQLADGLATGTVLRRNEPLAKKTTMRAGGNADIYVEPASEEDLSRVLSFCAERAVPVFILGRGSNLLIRDGGIRGVVISLAHPYFTQVRVEGHRVHCRAGARLKEVVMIARRAELGGLEFLEGIPGSVGGALRMNAGAMGGSLFEVLEKARFMDLAGRIGESAAREIPVEYRRCAFFQQHIALEAVLRGKPVPKEEIDRTLERFSQKRWHSQPAAPSAGCIFKNPPGLPAGQLIDELGLKGASIGDARVSEAHGNFIVNEGHATAGEILELIQLVQQRVRAARGIELEVEVQIVGEDQPPGKRNGIA